VLKVLAGMLTLQEGSLSNGPHRCGAWSQAYQRSVHLVLGGPLGFYPRLTGVENLQFVSGVFGHFLTRHAAQDALSSVGLADEAGRQLFAKYSLGMRQRLHLAAAVVDRGASVWLLDEPTTGLDADGVEVLSAILLGEESSTTEVAKVIVSHDRAFLERTCHRTVELKHGALVA
jgi:ABC-type multidrug transport system ATPase subunit